MRNQLMEQGEQLRSEAQEGDQSWRANALQETYGERAAAQNSSEGMVFSQSATKALSAEDVKGKSSEEIWLAKNEIYARHGRSFSNPDLAEHFSKQPWYKANPDYKDANLSPLEKRNAMYLHIVELDNDLNGQRARYKSESTVEKDLPDSVIADSSHRKLKVDEVMAMSPEQLRSAQNEIFARHGYEFRNADLKAHFEKMPWYKARPEFSEKDFSWLEQRNIQILNLVELDRKFGK